MRPTRSTLPFLGLLAPFVFVGGALVPASGAPGAPRPTNDLRSRGKETTADRPEVARLVTGSPGHLESVVAGTPPTAVLKVVPVPAKVGSYPGGTTIVGNELTAPVGGFRAWFEFKLGDWDPNGDNVPPLWEWEIMVDKAEFKGANADPPNPGVDLTLPVIACTNHATCVAAFGETWAVCGSGTPQVCDAVYTDGAAYQRADSWCADTGSVGCMVWGCDNVSPSAPRCFALYAFGVPRPDAGIEYYGATLVLDIPPTAQGKYTVNLDASETFLADTGAPSNDIPTLLETGFVVNILSSTVQACCHAAGGCTDLDSAECANAGDTPQGPGSTCQDTQCAPPTGACCNHGTASCTDGVPEANCSPPLEWTAVTLCVDLPNPCLMTGACCDSGPGAGGPGPEGACTDNLFEADCTGPNRVWTANAACTGVACFEVVGACCDSNPGGGGFCDDNLLQGECVGPELLWAQEALCADVVCVEDRGSCCNTATFACTENVVQADCAGADLLWRMDSLCERCASGPQILVTPVPAKVGSYPPGTIITGQEIRIVAGAGAVRVWFEARLRSWDLDGDGNPPAGLWQVQVDNAGFKGVNADPPNPDVDLTLPVIACADQAPCVTAFGEAWATCAGGTAQVCDAAYTDTSAPVRPDSWCADTGSGGCVAGACDTVGPSAPRCFGIYATGVPRPDAGIEYYGATLVLDIPAGALGKYTVNLNPDETFLFDTTGPPNEIPTFSETGFVVNIGPPTPLIVWNPSVSTATRASRTLTMSLVAATAAAPAGTAALRIKMVDLQHPNPRNRPFFPAPNFTAFDTTVNGVCSGATTDPSFNGHHCDTDADCLGPNANPLITTDDGTCGSLLACAVADGCVRWVGPVTNFREKQGYPGLGTYNAARLQCTPYYTDWTTVGAFSVFGAEIIPSSTYEGMIFGANCDGIESICTNVSPPVTMVTRRSGDVAAPWNPPDLSEQPTGGDVGEVLNKFKGSPGSPSNIAALIFGNLPDPNSDVGAQEISETISAFKGTAYPFSGPCACPSAVTCGQTACTSTNEAPCGAGLCVITCVGGDNAGLPCRDFPPNTPADHCPGGSCPTDGFCRDRCGRCN